MSRQLLIKTKMLKMKILLSIKLSDIVFTLLINIKMLTIVGMLIFCEQNFHAESSMKKVYNLGCGSL